MSSIDQQFIEYIVKSLVGNPDAVIVDRRIDEKGVLLELTVDPEDLGRVIGKRGATAQSLRTLLRALGTKNDARYNLKIVDNGVGEPRTADDEAGSSNSSISDDDGEQNAQNSLAAAPVAAQDDNDDDLFASTGSGSSSDSDDNSRVSKTRRELEELDDLDV
jgi:predicted RNA-binding protein YlqC (UPF0109 family)